MATRTVCDITGQNEVEHTAEWTVRLQTKDGNTIHSIPKGDACSGHVSALVKREADVAKKTAQFYRIELVPLWKEND